MKKRIGETSYKQTAFGIIPRSKLIPLEIEGIKRAWDFVLRENKKGKISITPELIKKLHKIGFAWIFPESGGQFRKIDVQVSNRAIQSKKDSISSNQKTAYPTLIFDCPLISSNPGHPRAFCALM